MIDESPNINSADKILEAATKLFAMDSFAAVSIKQISDRKSTRLNSSH